MSLKGKSYKMGLQELKEMIRSEVASAIKSMDGEAPTQDSTVGDLEDVIAQALELVEEKRKSRKEAGEEVGELTGEEIMEAVGEILDAAKSSVTRKRGKRAMTRRRAKKEKIRKRGKKATILRSSQKESSPFWQKSSSCEGSDPEKVQRYFSVKR